MREARSDLDLSQERLARDLDVTLRTVQRWEAGESQPGGSDLMRLAVRLSRDPGWFYDDEPREAA